MKILVYFFLTTCLFSGEIIAQTEETANPRVQTLPSFEGGPTEMYKFLYHNMRYPIEAKRMKISGQVITQFTVDQSGYLKDIQVVRGIDPSLDREAIRIIELMNEPIKWSPGTINGNPVDVVYTLPIKFFLQ